jgi:hypothetical protein
LNKWLNRGEQFWGLDIGKIEERYAARYVGDFSLRFGKNWSDEPFAVFFSGIPMREGYPNYVGVRPNADSSNLIVVNAKSVTEVVWDGVMADDGEVIFSRFRHDYRVSRDGSAMVDGGRHQFRCRGRQRVRISVVRDRLIVNDTELSLVPADEPDDDDDC